MAAKTKKVSKAPSGLKITRNGSKFEFSWKQPGAKYGKGQQLQWRVKIGDKWGKWKNISISAAATRKVVTVDASKYYPSTGKKLANMEIAVRGCQAETDKETFSWSGWSKKRFDIEKPTVPSVSAALSSTLANVSTFSWDTEISASSVKWFRDVLWESILVKDCSETDGSKLKKWKTTQSGWRTGTGTAEGSRDITEDTVMLASGSYARWFRIRARGPQGLSAWKYSRHVYAQPNQAKISKTIVEGNHADGYTVDVTWKASSSAAKPIDKTTVQYKIAVPAAGLGCPAGDAGWRDANISGDTAGNDKASFQVDDILEKDECLFVRVNTLHDRNTTYGAGKLAKIGKLKDPSGLSVQVDEGTFRATVTATNNSDVPDSFLAIKYRRSKSPDKDYVIGIIPHGQTSTNIQCPDWTGDPKVAFGVFAVVGSYEKKPRADGSDAYSVTKNMQSDHTVWDDGNVPKAPTVKANALDAAGTVRLTWNWSWKDADAAVLSWADHEDAWESTDEPSTYTVSNLSASAWNVSGLETGKTWYFRIRLVNGETEGPWSETVSIDLSSAPFKPALVLSEPTVRKGQPLMAYWTYISTDSTGQAYAEICTASVTGGVVSYGNILAHTETAQHVSVPTRGWQEGQTYLLCLRLTSASGHKSEWSDPVAVTVAEPVTAEITASSLNEITVVTDDETAETKNVLALTTMPFTVTVTGAGIGGITTVAIERAADYHIDRPDETEFHGFEHETVALVTQTGEGLIEIANDSLTGRLDDGAAYRLMATVQDGLGQSDVASMEFEVHWEHQAVMPEAVAVLDGAAVKITLGSPEGAETGDVCDIYRLSADRPVLVVEDGTMGETYVDPYPAIGANGGHRIVFKTGNGDYITEENAQAWIDLENGFEADYSIIDFAGEQLRLRYNLNFSNSWKKEFTETKYLGGSVQGDWNPGISRNMSLSSVSVTAYDDETIAGIRRLAVYPGICHVRTPDGSSFDADIQVSETRSWQSGGRKAEFSLAITRVDPEGLDGRTLAMWENETNGMG